MAKSVPVTFVCSCSCHGLLLPVSPRDAPVGDRDDKDYDEDEGKEEGEDKEDKNNDDHDDGG